MKKIEVLERGHITNKNLMVFLIVLTAMLSGMGVDIFTPSLPAICNYFQTTSALVKMTIPVFLVGWAAGVIILGTLSDSHGRKIIMYTGLILFTIFNLLTIFSDSIYMLLLLRGIAGFALGGASTVGRALLPDCFTKKSFAKATAFSVMFFSLGITIAPLIGGYLQDYIGWKGSFIFMSIFSLITLIIMLLHLPETNLNKKPLQISTIKNDYKIILSSKKYWGALIILTMSYSMLIIFNIYAPFILEVKMHLSAVEFGHYVFFIGLGVLLGAFLNLILICHYKATTLLIFGLFSFLTFTIIFIIFNLLYPLNILCFIIPIFFIYLGGRLTFPNAFMLCLQIFPNKSGSAAGIMGFLFTILTALIGFIASLINSQYSLSLGIFFLIFAIIGIISYYFLCRDNESKNLKLKSKN